MTRGRVLIVDDDASIRETFARTLGGWGYDVHLAASAEDALAGVHKVDPAVVVTDVRMAQMDGLVLLELLKERMPEVDVVVMTAFEDMRTAIAAMKSGAFEYLVKPLDLDRLELVLERCFRHRALRRRAQRLAADAGAAYDLEQLTGSDARMIEIYKTIGQVARSRAPVLVRGETGTGKELIARAIHHHSAESEEPFVAVNCTAIPEPLLESELFGHRKGAFTGAAADRRGRFALAGRGTVFLDEIGDTSGAFQAKLLRVLQEREFIAVGAERPERTEARVIAATHRDLQALVRAGGFREDLYFRLRVVELSVPPLRERVGDIPALAAHFLRKSATAMHRLPCVVTPAAMDRLTSYEWPGNVRELENAITRAVVLARGGVIDAPDLALGSVRDRTGPEQVRGDTLAEAEREQVAKVLAKTGGNKRKAARLLRVSRARLERLMLRHELGSPPGSDSSPHREHAGHESTPVVDTETAPE